MSGNHPLAHMRCVLCGELVEPLDTPDLSKPFDLAIDLHQTMWRDAGDISIGFGYGSRMDTCHFYGLIHDDCAKGLIEGAAAEFVSAGALGTPSGMRNVVEMKESEETPTLADTKRYAFPMNRTITLPQFLTTEQIKQAAKLGKAKEICEQVIQPNITEINRKLGQENDPMYLAYACEYVFTQTRR